MTDETIYMLLAAIASAVVTYCIITAIYKYRMRNATNIMHDFIDRYSYYGDAQEVSGWLYRRINFDESLIKSHKNSDYRVPGLHRLTCNYPYPGLWLQSFLCAVNLMGCEIVIRVVDNKDRDENATVPSSEEREQFMQISERVMGWKYTNPHF